MIVNKIQFLYKKMKSKVEKIEEEKLQLSGDIVKNSIDKLNLSETFDISRIRYDFGIKLKNNILVIVNSKFLEVDIEGNLYFIDESNNNENIMIGKIEDCLYEFDLYSEEWKKADLIRILSCTNFSIKCSKMNEINRAILENRDIEFYSNVNKHRNNIAYGGLSLNE